MKLRFKVIFIIFLFFSIASYLYIFEKPHRDYLREDAVISLSADDLFKEYQINQELSNDNYLNKMVEVHGKVALIEIGTSRSNISLDNHLFCMFQMEISEEYKEGDIITIKGRCIGYDDIFSQVTLDQCLIID